MAGFMPDGDYSIELHHTFMKSFDFFGFHAQKEMVEQDPYMTFKGTVKDDELVIGTVKAKLMDNPYFTMEFIMRGRLKGTRDVVIFRKIGSADLPGFGPGGK